MLRHSTLYYEDRMRRINHGLTESELYHLSTYNAERGRGLVHTKDWVQKMALLQNKWDEWVDY